MANKPLSQRRHTESRTVRFFNQSKGFLIITPDDRGHNVSSMSQVYCHVIRCGGRSKSAPGIVRT